MFFPPTLSSAIAAACSDTTVRLWQLDGSVDTILNGHSDSVLSLAFSPDGKLIATASADKT
ncbi:MAG: WD40 repeat domain-containing protein, partial [Chroococcales cyanobacterium]